MPRGVASTTALSFLGAWSVWNSGALLFSHPAFASLSLASSSASSSSSSSCPSSINHQKLQVDQEQEPAERILLHRIEDGGEVYIMK
ncbi:hypothetical protein ACLB2K_067737 [Fragaria x ananassa]